MVRIGFDDGAIVGMITLSFLKPGLGLVLLYCFAFASLGLAFHPAGTGTSLKGQETARWLGDFSAPESVNEGEIWLVSLACPHL